MSEPIARQPIAVSTATERRGAAATHMEPTLPTPLSSFVGRQRDIARVADAVRQPDVRLVTMLGPGGVGKTRLAIRVAGELKESYPNGVWFVALAPIRDPAMVAFAIAESLGIQETGARAIEEDIREFLRHRHALLILDNVEHLLEAGALVAALLEGCPELTVLATSRAVLNISGEHDVSILPL